MLRTVYLDRGSETAIAEAIVDTLEEDGGYSLEEMIPGLIAAVILLADKSGHRQLALDEATDLLVEG